MSQNALLEARNSPTAWFAVLERARLTGDKPLERRAITQLKRLGVSVQFDRQEDPEGRQK